MTFRAWQRCSELRAVQFQKLKSPPHSSKLMATSNHRQDQHSLTMSSPSDKDTDEGFSSSSSSSSFTFNSAQSLLQWSHRAAACTVKMGQWKKEADEKREKRMEERVEREGRRHHRERADREKVDRIKVGEQLLRC